MGITSARGHDDGGQGRTGTDSLQSHCWVGYRDRLTGADSLALQPQPVGSVRDALASSGVLRYSVVASAAAALGPATWTWFGAWGLELGGAKAGNLLKEGPSTLHSPLRLRLPSLAWPHLLPHYSTSVSAYHLQPRLTLRLHQPTLCCSPSAAPAPLSLPRRPLHCFYFSTLLCHRLAPRR